MDINNKLREMIIDKMQNGEYELKPCPFCGEKPVLMDKDFFDKLVSGDGRACIAIDCPNCDLSLHDHTSDENDYFIRAFLIAEKWNKRVEV